MAAMSGPRAGGGARTRLAAAAARRAWAWSGPLVCALFLAAAVLVHGDYGITADEPVQRNIAAMNADWARHGDDRLLVHWDRFYGVGFELPLLLAERALGLEDSRDVYLMRHLLTHVFFLAGALCCWLLALRLTGSRLLALLALLLFLTHPRIYAHSFFNSKDAPFLAGFTICLLLIHRAFRGGGVAAFALCGIAVGVLVNVRIPGAMLFLAVLGMRGLDLARAEGGAERRRVLATAGAFALAAALALYATWPWLWTDPVARFAEAFARAARYPLYTQELFRGQPSLSDAPPPGYVPGWFLVTTPPIALLAGLAGAAALARRLAAAPARALRNGEERFWLLLAACAVLPVIAAIAFGSHLYNGWRQMFFLYGPFCLLAAGGLGWLAAAAGRVRGEGARRAVLVLAAAGAAASIVTLVRLHPQQQAYFNPLAGRGAPEYVRSQYTMDYWGHPYLEALRHLLERRPEGPIALGAESGGFRDMEPYRLAVLPEEDRRRFVFSETPDFRVTLYPERYVEDYAGAGRDSPLVLWRREAHGSTLVAVVDGAAPRREFEVRLDGDRLTYAREPCAPDDVAAPFFLAVRPAYPADLRDDARAGYHDLGFRFADRGALADGRCEASAALPAYPIDRIRTGQHPLWLRDFSFSPPLRDEAAAAAWRAEHRRRTAGEPIARAAWDLHLDGRALTFAREDCAEEDTAARFFLRVVPADPDDLPYPHRQSVFDVLDFAFHEGGGRLDGRCMVTASLPDYPIAHVRAGQSGPGGELWAAEFPYDPAAWLARFGALAAREPEARGAFAVHLDGRALTYAREDCAAEDAAARFFLHVYPLDAGDLPPDRRASGFANLDFAFAERGVRYGGKCMAEAALPAWDAARIRTGQFAGGRELWEAEIAAAR